jgi:hypothetical protein
MPFDTLFTWRPDWAQGMTERLEWLTDVLPAFRGEEQRRGLRIGPRQAIEFGVAATDVERQALEAALWGSGARVWGVPLWYDGLELAAALPAASSSISLAVGGRAYLEGTQAVLLGDTWLDSEVVDLDTAGPSSLGLADPTTHAWPAGSRIYPLRTAHLTDSVALGRWDGATGTARLAFAIREPADYAAASSATYLGYPVLTTRPNWVGPPELSLERKLRRLDSSTGPVALDDEAELPTASLALRFTLANREELDAHRGLLYAMAGRRCAVWVPSHAQDLELVATTAAGDTTMDVSRCGYVDHLQDQPGRRDIRIELADGTVLYRRITGSTLVGSTIERLALSSAPGVELSPGGVALISFMALSRQAADSAELTYWSGDVADTAATLRSFRNDV